MRGGDLTHSLRFIFGGGGGKGHAVPEDKFVAAITFLLQMKRVKQSRAAEPGVSPIILHCPKWSMS